MRENILIILLLAIAEFISGGSVAWSDDLKKTSQNSGDEFREIAGELRCPTCTGLSVLDSDAPFSVQIKDEVKSQMAAGKSHAEILNFFMDRYGPWILRSPPVKGVNSLAWIIPIMVLLLGPVLIWYFVGKGKIAANEKPVRTTEQVVGELKLELKKRGVEELNA